MTYRGRVENGTVVFDEPVDLPEGTTVEIAVLEPPKDKPEEQPEENAGFSFYEHYKEIIGIAKGLPPDAARNHDHYLYGCPKR